MTAIKAFTDIRQSKKLAEILPLESADMQWFLEEDYGIAQLKEGLQDWGGDCTVPCWSLAALLDVIPQEIFDGEYVINITEGLHKRWILTYDHYENKDHSYYGLNADTDNLIDACYKLILKLHERKML